MKCSKFIARSVVACALACAFAMPGFAETLSPTVVMGHVNDFNQMTKDLKSIKTPQQAASYAAWLKDQLPRMKANHKRVMDTAPGLAAAIKQGKVTPEMNSAKARLEEIDKLEAEQNAEMLRVVKLHPAIKAHFDTIRSWDE